MTLAFDVAVRAEAELGEGATWDPATGRLLWIDILNSRVHTYDPATGRRTVRRTGQHVGAVKPRAGGGLVLNLRDGVGLLDPDDTFRWLHREPVAGRRGNDAAVAPDGSLLAGTMRYDEAPGGGTLSRVTGDGTATVLLDDVTVSNGTGWSPDGRLMYYIDTPTRRVDVFDFGGDGTIAGRRPLAEIEAGAGFPDGLTVDADGCVWVALWDGGAVRRYTPSGELDRVIELPVPRVTCCAFGGPGLTDLYVTTARVGLTAPHPLAGSLLVVPGAGKGVAQPAFAG
ncbi:SMP-30/gluconolactonase/LRE family protein [Streptomyces coelicolor]|uniref:SMP-30/gluconolactonase/LRE family protein n=1 Tax=Streptomyces griseoincarnatus TaxID=29305 RepID=A0ABT0VNI5_STRGI|nr:MULTISPECIES: SMP-30/gluconolactonase/LRE family protein [Streptomyces]MBJ6616747.1 SMP-30/gluconolactonase/LRE family protein [Streptomyces sp. I3(2020)]NUV54748.1 SMP-30/gluconolactonase/LRE family protein [Streptomyces coelicolor]MBJ6628644.1 SMP-30/gluconolactonase/LRE family protein [Streptomyces sp. I4(2020)]MBJ6632329.1 SMP-30/gluconolactonase/LRE family protein [Streptomyces sp. I5]MCM2512917.1 SMP-30/gluconolactonase/LRE family protein [Streptomyces griseoincarnatus]